MSSSQELQRCIALTEEGEQCSRPARGDKFCYQHDESDDTVEDEVDDGENAEPDEQREQQMDEGERGQQMQEGTTETDEQSSEEEQEQESDSVEDEPEQDESEDEAGEQDQGEEGEPEQEETEANGEETGDESIEITSHSSGESERESSEEDQEQQESGQEVSGDLDISQIREHVDAVASDIVGYPLDGIARIEPNESGAMVAIEVIERNGIPDTQDIIGRYELALNKELTVASYERTHRYRRDDMEHDI